MASIVFPSILKAPNKVIFYKLILDIINIRWVRRPWIQRFTFCSLMSVAGISDTYQFSFLRSHNLELPGCGPSLADLFFFINIPVSLFPGRTLNYRFTPILTLHKGTAKV